MFARKRLNRGLSPCLTAGTEQGEIQNVEKESLVKSVPPLDQTPLCLRELAVADCDEMRALFEKVFKQPLSALLWHWKYADGRGIGLGAFIEEKLIGHYGGLAREILYKGQKKTAIQIVDVMVDSRAHGSLKRKGPFFSLATNFFERYSGYDKPYLLAYGFPNLRHRKISYGFGLHKEVDIFSELVWPAVDKASGLRNKLQKLDLASSGDRCLADRLWEQMAGDLANEIVGCRDAGYLQHRYLNHPERDYQLFVVTTRFTRQPVGLFVVRVEDETLLLLDVVCPLRNIAPMVYHARRQAYAMGLKSLKAWISSSHSRYFPEAEARETDIHISAQMHSPGPSIDQLQGQWWATPGDTDFK